MKIAHITYTLTFGGIETMLVNIANYQVSKAEVYIIIINDAIEQTLVDNIDPKIKVIRIGRPIGSKNPFYIARLNTIIFKLNADILHIHHPGIIRFIPFKPLGSKIVFTMHDIPVVGDYRYLPKYKNIYAISRSVQTALKKIGYDSILVYNGIIPDQFQKKVVLRHGNDLRIVQVGRLMDKKKGQIFLIDVVKDILEKTNVEVSLDFIGDGPSRIDIEEIINRYGLCDHIKLLGNKNQEYIQSHLKDYDLLVQPSFREGFGLTVAESMAACVPVLVSNQEGPMEIINNGEFGFYFKVGDKDGCREKILFISQHPEECEIMAVRANAHVKAYFDVRNTALNYLKEYENLLIK